jgi:DNA-binding NarL/FixJ family response regulator
MSGFVIGQRWISESEPELGLATVVHTGKGRVLVEFKSAGEMGTHATAMDEIRREDASARVIVLTTYDTDNEIYRAVKAGAKGYVLKDARREELLDCIRRVSRGEICIPPPLLERLAAGVSGETLTGREMDVLTLLARGKSSKEIGMNLYISETTVKAHLRSIFTKLNVLSRTEAIAAASRRGLVQL